MRYPRDFKSRLAADLTLTGRTGDLVLGGQVRLERGLYDKDIDLEQELLAGATAPEPAARVELPALGLDLQVATERAVLIRNNLGELNVTGRLRCAATSPSRALRPLRGPRGRQGLPADPRVRGRARRLVYQGTLEPDIASARDPDHAARRGPDRGHDRRERPAARARPLDLSSEPSYSEKEIASLIATGRRKVALDSTAWVAGEQAAALLAGRATRALERGFEPLGLDEVDIQPELLAREGDPSARFTFGKHLTPGSAHLLDRAQRRRGPLRRGPVPLPAGPRADARLMRDGEGILLRRRPALALRRPDRGGGPGARGAPSSPTCASRASSTRTRRAPCAKPGDEVSAWDLQDDAERLERRLRATGTSRRWCPRASTRTSPSTRCAPGRATRPGPRARRAPDLQTRCRRRSTRKRRSSRAAPPARGGPQARPPLGARRHARSSAREQTRTLVFTVDAGPAVDSSRWSSRARTARPRRPARGGRRPGALLTSAARAREGIAAAYRDHHYLEPGSARRAWTRRPTARASHRGPGRRGPARAPGRGPLRGPSPCRRTRCARAAQLAPGDLPAARGRSRRGPARPRRVPGARLRGRARALAAPARGLRPRRGARSRRGRAGHHRPDPHHGPAPDAGVAGAAPDRRAAGRPARPAPAGALRAAAARPRRLLARGRHGRPRGAGDA